MVDCLTRGGVNFDHGDNFRYTGSFRFNVSDIFSNLEGGVGGGRRILVLIVYLSVKRTSEGGRGGGLFHIVLITFIIGRCCSTGTAHGWLRGGIRGDGQVVF